MYTGRVDAHLSLGDYMLMLRDPGRGGDGSCLVYSASKGLGPRNWMPAGSAHTRTPNGWVIEHVARGERLDIFLDTVHWSQDADPLLEGELTKLGSEREFSDLLAAHLATVIPGLELVGREVRTPAGPVDLLCTDAAGPVIIEVKRRRVVQSDVWQARRYLHALAAMPDWQHAGPRRAILVAPALANPAKALIAEHGDLTFARVSYEQLRDLPAAPAQAPVAAVAHRKA